MSISKVYCSYCDKEVKENEEFIVVNNNEVYCRDCAEEDSITIYEVMGNCVGDENNTEEHNIKSFEKALKNEIKNWEDLLKDWENIETDEAKHHIEFFNSKLRQAKDRYKQYFE